MTTNTERVNHRVFVLMHPGIHLSRSWFDDDVIELVASVSDGVSLFVNTMYVEPKALSDTVASLRAFEAKVHGGLYDMRFGGFGPEYANGALCARFHFSGPGCLLVTTSQECRLVKFGDREVASRATMYLETHIDFLSRFIDELIAFAENACHTAYLEAFSRAID